MKKLFTILLLTILCLSLVFASGGSGSIKTTRDDCGDIKQNVNQYMQEGKKFILMERVLRKEYMTGILKG